MEQEFSYISLLIITSLAFFIPLLMAKAPKLSLPIVVGEILAGIIVGKSGFDLINTSSESILFLSSFGFTYLMFLSGLEIDVSLLSRANARKPSNRWSWVKSPMGIAALSFVLTLMMASAIAYILYRNGVVRSFPLMALILSTTSLGVVVPTIKERKLTGTSLGQTILLAALAADFITMVLITLVASLIGGDELFNLLLTLVLFAAFFLLYRLGLLISRTSID